MEEKYIIEPCIGDAIIKKETITWEQMLEEFKQHRLSHNPEMNIEFRKKWHSDLNRYWSSGYSKDFYDTSLPEYKVI